MARALRCSSWAAAAAATVVLTQARLQVPTVPMHGVDGKVDMPLFGLGTWQYNDSVAAAAIQLAFSVGYRHVDTALVYNNHKGVSLGLKNAGVPRDEFFVTTKIPGGLNSSATAAAADQSLSELGLSYVDLMLLHFPATFDGVGGRANRQEQWAALERWAMQGKARAIGVSHYCRPHLEDILSIAKVPIAVNQVQYHIGMGTAGRLATDDRDFVLSKGILYQSFSPLCGPCTPPLNKELYSGDLVSNIGRNYNKTGSQVSLRWLVQQNIPVIPKSTSKAHLQSNMALFDFSLSDDEMRRLSAATSPGVGGGPNDQESGDCSIAVEPSTMTIVA